MKTLLIKRFLPIVLIIPSLIWIFIDKSLWLWDPAMYGSETIRLSRILIQQPTTYLHNFLTVLSYKAPMICWVGQLFVPLGSFIGYEKALLLMQIITSFLIVIVSCNTTYFSKNKSSLITIIFLICSTPIFIFQSHFYFVEVLQTFGVVVIWNIFLNRENINPISMACAYTACFFFLLGVKITSPAYIVLPSIFILLELFKKREALKFKALITTRLNITYITLTALIALTVSSWYFLNLEHVLSFAKAASSGSVALNYGRKADIITKFIFWIRNFSDLFWGGRTQLTLGGMVILSLLAFWRKIIDFPFLIALTQVLIVLLLMSLQINEETRYIYPLLAYWIFIIGRASTQNKYFMLIFICIFAFRWTEFHLGTLGIWPLEKNLRWSNIPDRKGDNLDRSRNIVKLLKAQSDVKNITFGIDTAELNLDSFQFVYFTQSKSFERPPLSNIGFAQTDLNDALKHIKDNNCTYFITLPLPQLAKLDDFLNRVSLQVAVSLQKSGWVTFSEGSGYLILKKPN